jgi:hypothetical protein
MAQRTKNFHALSISALAALLLAGCNSPASWDQEYACTGQEQSNSSFPADTSGVATQKSYPMTIDFHLRAQNAMVKAQLVALESTQGDVVSFSGRSSASWIHGQFDKRDGKLSVVEEVTLPMSDRTQQVRTSGQYTCKT